MRTVIYHANCVDGFTAAWACWKRFGYSGTRYVAASYGDAPPDVAGHDVWIVDFSYPRAVLEDMRRSAEYLVVLDHHKTAAEDLADLEGVTFDMNRSGAGLAWDRMAPLPSSPAEVYGEGSRRPWLVDYVEDRDLWRFKLLGSKAVNAYVGIHPRTFEEWDHLARLSRQSVEDRGDVVLRTIEHYVGEVRKNAVVVRWVVDDVDSSQYGSYDVPVVNAPHFAMSELLHELCQGRPFAAGWYQRADGLYSYSLRSAADGVDVSAVARCWGGGGHKHAAGFARERRLSFDYHRAMEAGR